MTAQGEYLGARFVGLRKPEILEMLRDAKTRWDRIVKEKQLTPQAIPDPTSTWPHRFQDSSLVLQVALRDLPRKTKPHYRRAWHETAWNSNWLDYRSEQESLGFLPREGETKSDVPKDVVHRLAARCLVDNVRGQRPPWNPRGVKEATMTTEKIAEKDGQLLVRLHGSARMEEGGSGYTCQLHGRAVYDKNQKKYLLFELVAVGTRHGKSQYNAREGDEQPSPMGVAFGLENQTDRPLPAVCASPDNPDRN